MEYAPAVLDRATDRPAGGKTNAPIVLSAAFRARTRALHLEAERTGIIRELIGGHATRQGYAWLLSNLLPVYDEMEDALSRSRHVDSISSLALPCVYRAEAIRADLESIIEPHWAPIPFLPAARRYAWRVRAAGRGDGALLIAHAYTRYLGDLNGGRIMGRILADSLRLAPDSLGFCGFADIADIATFIADYRMRIDRAAESLRDRHAVVEEAAMAFNCNIGLSKAIGSRFTARPASARTGAR